MIFDYLIVGALVLAGFFALMAAVCVIVMVRMKIRKEWGYFKRHNRYHPAKPKKILKF